MRKQILFFVYLFFMLFSLTAGFFVVHSFSPTFEMNLAIVEIPIWGFFFVLLFMFIFSCMALFFRSKLQGILLASFTCTYFFFRMEGLTKPLYQILLLLIFLSVELFFYQKRQEKRNH